MTYICGCQGLADISLIRNICKKNGMVIMYLNERIEFRIQNLVNFVK